MHNNQSFYRKVSQIGPYSREGIAWAIEQIAPETWVGADAEAREVLVDSSIAAIASREPGPVTDKLREKPSWDETAYQAGYQLLDSSGKEVEI